MNPRQRPSSALLRLAGLQAGVVTREQALGLGLTDRVLSRLGRDQWRALGRGLYLTSGAAPSWEAWAWAGVLAGGDGARLGPRASGWRHGLLDEPPMPVDVLVDWTMRRRPTEHWFFLRERPGSRTGRTLPDPPRLTVEDALLDLAADAGETQIIALVTGAVQSRRTTPARLSRALGQRSRQPSRPLVLAAIADAAIGAHSALEVSYLRDVERAHGLPTGRRQQSPSGLPHFTDVDYDRYLLLVELDGALYHSGLQAFWDLDRDNVHALLHRLTLRYSWFHVRENPCRVAAQVARHLTARGWTGTPTRCPRCFAVPDQDWGNLWTEVG